MRVDRYSFVYRRHECCNLYFYHFYRQNYEYDPPYSIFNVDDYDDDDDEFGSKCTGDKPLILLSSGHKSHISLSDVPVVLVCPGSISPYLQHLDINGVPQVRSLTRYIIFF